MRRLIAPLALSALALAGCAPAAPAPPEDPAAVAVLDRLDALDAAVAEWAAAPDTATAHAAAEEVRNLVVGPDGPGYGDADGDGVVRGEADTGLLPDPAGGPGLASALDSPCVDADVLGGSWADPAARWAVWRTAVDEWTPTGNTFPGLPSHPQRVAGWATLALADDDLETVHEYAGHAALHVAVSRTAVLSCG